MGTLKQTARELLRKVGFDIVRYRRDLQQQEVLPQDLTPEERKIYEQIKPYTKTSIERIVSLIQATQYIVRNNLRGDLVECGVWRGGSIMAVALTLKALGDTSRTLFLYDTFEGMTEPTDEDQTLTGRSAKDICDETPKGTGTWCYATLEEVQHNLRLTGYPEEKIRYIQGPVEETIPTEIPQSISLLRLDTDWYASTLHELNYLYPLLEKRGVLLIDDFGHWQGAKQATEEYFAHQPEVFLHRIDYTGRLIIKPDE